MNRILSIAGICLALVLNTQTLAAGDPERGKSKSTPCQACHGVDGNSSDANFPKLAGQQASYIVQALKDYQSGKRKNPIIAGFAGSLSQQDREDLAAYFAGQKGLFTLRD